MEGYDPINRFLNKRYDKASLSLNQFSKEGQKWILEWINNPRNFIVFLGRPGCGKTFLAVAIANYLFEKEKKLVDYPEVFLYPIRKIYDEFRICYQQNKSDQDFKNKLYDVKYLIIDDLGASRNNEWQKEIILDILDNRYNSLKPTIITSNLNFQEIEEVFDKRIRSRLEAAENLIFQDWETDYRAKGK